MSKITLAAAFSLVLGFMAYAPVSYAADQTIADMHAEMAECESCHAGGEPSADGNHENGACIDCHGPMAEMVEPHPTHEDVVRCIDCHKVHDMNVGEMPNHENHADDPNCTDCHG
ncbi:cytochrome c3 family protein [Paraferrimonas haliotis]|uniref:Cytochrome c n=1 Tax=Paraferrimonas haliotis TaxID=2013866 RepID=A0AA37WVY9_9GAMM|nr:cytochrome c3 family protein [Paraferrimonas haliotis]GLS82667.1 cytochrome c [Paraferrimonas haliotis]